ncbi:RsmB/NOP family class I SAM-dependent RNA methyltransferase [Rhizophagus clarus]|uniref:NOL1/NOP2/Sun domain family member 4 n=2 Tax=Rhizophagus clarus TaxID=94130 RepID=A0A8H3M604_9GLOM|nr:RsmB/NOP family class I SAM-dependent RNA methyltransferase [Rhizophagus clarus]
MVTSSESNSDESNNKKKRELIQQKKLITIKNSINEFYMKQYDEERWYNLLNSLKKEKNYCTMINKFISNDSKIKFINNNNNNMKKVNYLDIPCYISNSKFSLPKKDEHSNLLNVYHIDLASVIVTKALDIQPNDIILDLCAAPGGKSLAILQRLLNNNEQIDSKNKGRGILIANEVNNKRFHRLLQVIKSYIPFKYHQHQIKLVKNSPIEKYCYDKILVDAPCSSERHLINNQKELLMWKESRSKNFSKKQYNILLGAVKALKVNGILVYSTCSISNLENDHVIKKILENSWVKLKVIKRKYGWEIGEETEFGWIILPDKCDGWGPMYFSILKRIEVENFEKKEIISL